MNKDDHDFFPPKVCGFVGKITEGEHIGKWGYEISVWNFTQTERLFDPIQIIPFETMGEAQKVGRAQMRIIMDEITTKMQREMKT